MRAYVEAVENAFGMNVDFAMVVKNYGSDKGEHHQERRYSAGSHKYAKDGRDGLS